MKKQQRNILIGVVIILIIGIVISSNGFKPFAISGYTSLSISNVQIVDSGQKIRIYGVSNGAEQISINFNPSQLNSYLNSQGYEATKSVTGSITLEKQNKLFSINKNTNENFKKFYSKKLGISLCRDSDCNSNTPLGYTYNNKKFGGVFGCVCLYENSAGTNSIFTGSAVEDSIVNFNIDGSTRQLKPSQGSNVITLNDGKTTVEWVGSLNNYQTITYPSYSVLFSGSQFSKLISSSAYSNYKNSLSTLDSCVGASGNLYNSLFGSSSILINLLYADSNKISNCIGDHNNRVEGYLSDVTSTYKNSINAQSVSFDSNNMIVELNTPSQFPTFIITLDAQSVGIIELKGTPDIQNCVANKDINSGDTYSTGISVKNIGANDGSFYGQVTCGNKVYGTVSETYFTKGETKLIPVTVSGQNTVSGTEDSTCTIKIIDRKSQQSDSCNFVIGVKYQQNIICSPSSKLCISSKTLRICDSQGTSYNDIICDNCVQTGNIGECVGDVIPNITTTCKSCESYAQSMFFGWALKDKKCESKGWTFSLNPLPQNETTCIFTLLKYLLTPIIFFIILLVGMNNLSKLKGVPKWLSVSISILIALILGWMVFMFFWIGIIISVIALIGLILIKVIL